MATHAFKGLGQLDKAYDGSSLRIGIVHARWNDKVISALLDGAVQKIKSFGVKDSNIVVESVPGSFELPFGCRILHQRGLTEGKPFDAVIAIGTLIKGDTVHFEYISEVTSHGLMRLQGDIHIPVIFGVLTCLTEDQALVRAGLLPNGHNHGEDWGAAAVEMSTKWNHSRKKQH